MNILQRWVQKQLMKVVAADQNELFRQMFQFVNNDIGITLRDTKDFIDKGYLYNDLIYSIISTKQEIGKSINWLAYKVVDDKAFRGMHYHMKAYAKGINPAMNLKNALNFRKKALEEVENTEANRLVKSPNGYQTLPEIISEYFGWIDLTGNFYLYKLTRDDAQRTVSSVHVAPSQEVEIVAGDWFDPIKGYRLKSYLAYNEIPKELIMHLKTWNPDFDYDGRQLYGVSPLQAGARILNLDNKGIDTSTANFNNSGVRGIIHRATGAGNDGFGFTPEQADQMKKKIESWEGVEKSGKIVATNAPVGFTEIGKSPVDLGVFTAMDKNQVRLCNLFKVPPELFLPGTTFSNKAEARKNMITTGILPQMELLRDKLNEFMIAPLNVGREKYYIDYDLFSIAELQEDLGKISQMLQGATWLTDDEKREAMNYGEFGHPLAKELFVDPFKMPMSQVTYDSSFDDIDEELKRLKSKVY